MSLLANSNAIESGGYNIDRSLRFRSSASAYLSRIPASASNRKTWTWSGWVKRSDISSADIALFTVRTGAGANYTLFYFNGQRIQFLDSLTSANVLTTSVYRDPSSWYHLICSVDTTQATASNRVKIYVNGVQVTALTTATYPTLNGDTNVDSTDTHLLGVHASAQYFDGYLAEVNFIDGQALTPSSFGETSTETGVWVPKKYTGTYGTNGFYLNFSDNTSATTLAYDKSGNSNNWTANNISTTAGATYDSMTDVPTLTSATAANYCVLNPLDKGSTVTNGNLTTNSSAAHQSVRATMQIPSTGLYYMEATILSTTSATVLAGLGLAVPSVALTGSLASAANAWFVYCGDVLYINRNGTQTLVGGTTAAGSVIQIAVDMANSRAWFGINNVWYDSSTGTTGNPSTGTNPTFTSIAAGVAPILETYQNTLDANFGQRPFSYTPPTGFKALNTFNLPDPTIKKPNQYMDVVARNGFGASGGSVTSVNFQPDFYWGKTRSAAANHTLLDSVRGVGSSEPYLSSNTTSAEATMTNYLLSFNSNGYTMGSSDNATSTSVVEWLWKKGATPGFDIVTYTGDGNASQNINHSLGVTPAMVIGKARSTTSDWYVGHKAVQGANFAYYGLLNSTAAWTTGLAPYPFGTAGPTAIPVQSLLNANGTTYVIYAFAEIPGFSKFGSYTGNGSADGPFVYCGFRPKYVMVKRSDSTGSWLIRDSARDGYNVTNLTLLADSSGSEASAPFDILSNGFKVRDTGAGNNANGGTYIYAAFADNPFKYSNAR